MGKRTIQKDAIKDTASDSQVHSYFPYMWSPANAINSLTINNYFYLFSFITRTTINNGTRSCFEQIFIRVDISDDKKIRLQRATALLASCHFFDMPCLETTLVQFMAIKQTRTALHVCNGTILVLNYAWELFVRTLCSRLYCW